MSPVLEIRDLKVRLPARADRAYAVEGVSFHVDAGEIVCLVGESGSGKSVISFSAMGLLDKGLRIETGEILVQGEGTVGASEARLRELRCTRMGMIFQEPMTALNPVMRCGAQIDEVLRRHTRLSAREREARILEMIGEVHLPDPERMYASFPHQLSGGQRQRIMIAMALIMQPALLIADEPTTALDVTTQAQILKLLREIQRKRGAGVLFITHDFGVVARNRPTAWGGCCVAAGWSKMGRGGGRADAPARPLYPNADRRGARPRAARPRRRARQRARSSQGRRPRQVLPLKRVVWKGPRRRGGERGEF